MIHSPQISQYPPVVHQSPPQNIQPKKVSVVPFTLSSSFSSCVIPFCVTNLCPCPSHRIRSEGLQLSGQWRRRSSHPHLWCGASPSAHPYDRNHTNSLRARHTYQAMACRVSHGAVKGFHYSNFSFAFFVTAGDPYRSWTWTHLSPEMPLMCTCIAILHDLHSSQKQKNTWCLYEAIHPSKINKCMR